MFIVQSYAAIKNPMTTVANITCVKLKRLSITGNYVLLHRKMTCFYPRFARIAKEIESDCKVGYMRVWFLLGASP